MLNEHMDAAVLVRGYKKGASWSFPRGKINKDEDDLDCAVREVYEETGFDLRESGLVSRNEPVHPLEVTMHDQQVRLYVFRGVPENTVFETRTRKEIGDIKWYKVEDLPAYRKKKGGRNYATDGPSKDKFYMVAPFMVQLRQWVIKQKKLDAPKIGSDMNYHHHQGFYDDNLTDDNVVHEPTHVSPSRGTNPKFIDSATEELQRLLKVQPPTQGLQIPTPTSTSNQLAGHTLLALLQPKSENEQPAYRHVQAPPYNTFTHAPHEHQQPQPHHHHQYPSHPEQRMPAPEYRMTQQLPTEANVNMGYSQPARARPYVNVSTELPHPPTYSEHPPQFRNQPVNLVHPQPLPPQVQKAMLLRGMASSPQIADSTANRSGPSNFPSGLSQEIQYTTQAPQVHHHIAQGAHNENRMPPQLPVQSANLLNVLKGSASQANAGQRPGSDSPHQSTNVHAGQSHPHPFPASGNGGNGFAGQYGAPAMQPSFSNSGLLKSHASTPDSSAPLARPTDKHRAGLLDMFKKTGSPLSQGQLDGESEKKRQWNNSSPSTANTLRTAAHETGRPMVMNPETNLPFGALSILSRSRPSASPTGSAAVSAKHAGDASRYSAVGSQPSPSLSHDKTSPSFTKAQSRPRQLPPPKTQQMGQSSPRSYAGSMQSYPYGASQEAASNTYLFSNPPSASSLPVPGGLQFRKNSTTEHKNTLLSLFGKPSSNAESSKGKEVAVADQLEPGDTQRSRLSSFTSAGGEATMGVRGNKSRRGSQAPPLSPADRDFLMNFLESASGNVRR